MVTMTFCGWRYVNFVMLKLNNKNLLSTVEPNLVCNQSFCIKAIFYVSLSFVG